MKSSVIILSVLLFFCTLALAYLLIPKSLSEKYFPRNEKVKIETVANISPEEKIAAQTWGLFVNGCVDKSANLQSWADAQKGLEKTGTAKNFAGQWKNLGYPVPDKLKNMWSIVGAPVYIYQHENQGCTVTSSANIGPEKLKKYFQSLANSAKKNASLPSTLQVSHSDPNMSTVMLSFYNPAKKNGQKIYVIGRSFENDQKIKTMLYYVRTDTPIQM